MRYLTGINGLRWLNLLKSLPAAPKNTQMIDGDCIQIGDPTALSQQDLAQVRDVLEGLGPWRKGPFTLYGIHIDAEWRSGMKWRRLSDWIAPYLTGKEILDIGCGNGYYMMRFLAHKPKSVLGLDPSLRFYAQFQALQHFLQNPLLQLKPLGIDELNSLKRQWDTVLCMGVLYHRRDRIGCLMQLRSAVKKNGNLILETLIIPGEGDDYLVPKSRYAQMKNVYSIPTVNCLKKWLVEAGFSDIDVKSVERTTVEEQRSTSWSAPVSLRDFLDPKDQTMTIEGHPAPTRVVVLCA